MMILCFFLSETCDLMQMARLTGSQEYPCPFCRAFGVNMINSHIVPKSVLLSLLCWKSGCQGSEGRYTKEEQEEMGGGKCMFRTDIAKGKIVNAAECTTREPNQFLCMKCENNLQSLDDSASYFWQHLPKHWQDGNQLHIACKECKEWCSRCERCKVITSVFLFSVVARAMFLSVWSEKIRALLNVFIAETDRCTYPETTAKLQEANFLHFCLRNPTYKTYRIEFPFICDIKLNGENIKTICAQIPPFFILIPEEGYDHFADDLQRNMQDIIPLVQRELQNQLESFYVQEKRKWYKQLIDKKQVTPLLVFNYIEKDIIKVLVS